jgi:hypothetical protein
VCSSVGAGCEGYGFHQSAEQRQLVLALRDTVCSNSINPAGSIPSRRVVGVYFWGRQFFVFSVLRFLNGCAASLNVPIFYLQQQRFWPIHLL